MNKKNSLPVKILIGFVLLVIVLLTIYPMLWMISGSLKGTQEFYTNTWGLPEVFQWSNYTEAWKRADIGLAYKNSFIITACSLALVIPSVGCAAYVIARVDFKMKRALYMYLLLGLCIPTGVMAIPIFSVALEFNMLDKLYGMILFHAAQCMSFGMFLLRSFFISLPKSLEEAAMIDGCSRFQSFLKVILPLAKPGVMTLVVLDGINIWNEYLLGTILIRSEKNMTLPLGMKAFVDKYVTDYPQLFAGLVLSTIPIIVVYIFAQRSFVEGMTAGSVKQ